MKIFLLEVKKQVNEIFVLRLNSKKEDIIVSTEKYLKKRYSLDAYIYILQYVDFTVHCTLQITVNEAKTEP